MSKIYMIGDTHLGLGFPNKYDKWINIHKQYFNDFLIPTLKRNVKKGDIIIHLGDLFDNRSVIPLDLLSYTQKILEIISSIAPLHIIVGNHDLYTKNLSDINSINLYKYIPNVFIYEKPTKINFNNKKILLMPYIENKEEQIDIIKSNKECDYLFCHSDLNGCKMHLTSIANKNTNKIDIEEFKNFNKVYSGHIHLVQKNKNFTFVGSIFQMDRNDFENVKGIFVLDTESNKDYFIENNISPIFTKIVLQKESDITLLDSIDPKNFNDIFISNSLIISNKKLRRSIETYLTENSFENVEYIDDISNKKEIEEVRTIEDLKNSELIKTVNLDYKEIIIDYTKSISYEDDIKEKILNELKEIIKINESRK